MKIIPSTRLMTKYDEISKYCRIEGKPVFLTDKDGEGDLVVISLDEYNRQKIALEKIMAMLNDELNKFF
ncbi:MAG: prevent-host-death protein [Oscillospiraceae bacterium]|nr:prevent-host-death protein [Oscillospiraceae bacterium]